GSDQGGRLTQAEGRSAPRNGPVGQAVGGQHRRGGPGLQQLQQRAESTLLGGTVSLALPGRVEPLEPRPHELPLRWSCSPRPGRGVNGNQAALPSAVRELATSGLSQICEGQPSRGRCWLIATGFVIFWG